MDFNVNRDAVKMLELLAKYAELRRMVYTLAGMVWVVWMISVIRWW